MNPMDRILQRLGLKFDDLTSAERETLMGWMDALKSNQINVSVVKDFVHSLRDNIEGEIVKVENGTKQDTYLKARLRNIMLLEAFLSTPEKAQQALDRAVAGIAENRGAKGGE